MKGLATKSDRSHEAPEVTEIKDLLEDIERKMRQEGLISDRPVSQRCAWCAQQTEDWGDYEGHYVRQILCFECRTKADWIEALLNDRVIELYRHVQVDRERHAFFLRENTSQELWLLNPPLMDALPCFDPDGYTDEELAKKIKIYLTFL